MKILDLDLDFTHNDARDFDHQFRQIVRETRIMRGTRQNDNNGNQQEVLDQ